MNVALVRSLLDKHSIKDVHALMQRCVSGVSPTLEQIRNVRRKMLEEGAPKRPKNVSLLHIRDEPVEIEPVEFVPKPEPIVVFVAPRQPPKEPETFESQLARISAGARLIAAPDFRTGGPAYTLGGIGSALL